MVKTKSNSLPDELKNEIINEAIACNINKVILFGSRARGTNNCRSDIDIAISGSIDQYEFKDILDEKINTLLSFDIVSLDDCSETLLGEIKKDGVILYEKV